MFHKLEHVGVMVTDMERSIAFYTDILGLKLSRRLLMDSGTELAFLSYSDAPGVEIELISEQPHDYVFNGKVNHLTFTVSEIERETERLREHGVQLLDEAPFEALGGARILFFLGPDGEKLEMFQPAPPRP